MDESRLKIIKWTDFQDKFIETFSVQFQTVDLYEEFLLKCGKEIHWHQLPDWEDYGDQAIISKLCELQNIIGTVFFVSEATYLHDNSPFHVDAAELSLLGQEHVSTFNECLFNGDLIATNFDRKQIWLFHHEGAYAYLHF